MRTLANLSYSECAPVIPAEAMRFLDNDTKMYNSRGGGFGSIDENADSPIAAGYELMKRAGAALFRKAIEMLGPDREGKAVAVFVGGGNNGGDGLVLSKLLIEAHVPCPIYSLAKAETFKNEAALAYADFAKAGGQFSMISDLPARDPSYALIVDCILGNGASGELRPAFAMIVLAINDWGIPILSADSPTGFDSSEHRRGNPCIQAAETLLFGLPRQDAFTEEGASVFGKVTIEPLEYPDELIDKVNHNVYLATEKLIPELLPDRKECGDKRAQGTALIIAGSGDMTGAAALCTKAALRSGVGLVTLATPRALLPTMQAKLDEPVFCGIGDRGADKLSVLHLMQLQDASQHQNALAIGPGLGTDPETQDAIRMFLTGLSTPVVIDADAINACGSAFFCIKGGPANAIVTPHKREWERNFGPLPSNECYYPEYLQQFAKQFNITILLKGSPIYVALPDGRVFIVPARNSGLAKGGSGDVLTGIVVSLLAQGLATAEAAVLGALLHQKAGSLAREKWGAFGMLPSDVIEMLPDAFGRV